MSLIDFIQKLQQKPRHIRVRILWLSVCFCMLIIVSLWLVLLRNSLSNISDVKKENGVVKEFSESIKEIKKEIPSLKESLKANVGSFFEESPDIESLSKELEKDEQFEEKLPEIKPAKLPLSQ